MNSNKQRRVCALQDGRRVKYFLKKRGRDPCYLVVFRTASKPRFVCEAKKPAEELPPHAQQAKGYAWTIGVPLAVLSDFEELNLYIVGSEPKQA